MSLERVLPYTFIDIVCGLYCVYVCLSAEHLMKNVSNYIDSYHLSVSCFVSKMNANLFLFGGASFSVVCVCVFGKWLHFINTPYTWHSIELNVYQHLGWFTYTTRIHRSHHGDETTMYNPYHHSIPVDIDRLAVAISQIRLICMQCNGAHRNLCAGRKIIE